MSDRIAITPAVIRSLKFPTGSNQKHLTVWDDEVKGFHVRITPGGAKTFWLKFSLGNRQRYKNLGDALPGVLAEARKQAAEIKLQARVGRDALAEAKRKANRATVGELVPVFVKALRNGTYFPNGKRQPRKATIDAVERYLVKGQETEGVWKPLHRKNVDEVRRADVNEVLNKIAAERGRVTADRARSALSSFYGWVIDEEHCETSPLQRLRNRAGKGGRERVLSAAELRTVWQCAGDGAYGKVVRLLILTGQRKTEIGSLRAAEINKDARQIELPAARTKNGRPHIVPLSPLAWDVLNSAAETTFLFGRYGRAGLSGWSKCKEGLDVRIARTGDALPHWTLHDLRRTFSTHMHEMGIAEPHIVEACINHVSGHKASVAGTYNRAAYLVQKRAAFEAWAQWVAALVARKA